MRTHCRPLAVLVLSITSCAAQTPQAAAPTAPSGGYSAETTVAAFAQAQQLQPLPAEARDPDLMTSMQFAAPLTRAWLDPFVAQFHALCRAKVRHDAVDGIERPAPQAKVFGDAGTAYQYSRAYNTYRRFATPGFSVRPGVARDTLDTWVCLDGEQPVAGVVVLRDWNLKADKGDAVVALYDGPAVQAFENRQAACAAAVAGSPERRAVRERQEELAAEDNAKRAAEEKAQHDRAEADDRRRKAETEERELRHAALVREGKVFRMMMAVGTETHCGMVIEMKPPIVKVQTLVGEKWFRAEQLYPPGALACRFVNGVYEQPR